jgi:hypothetical protein
MGLAENNYVTQHYENARTGWNPNETTLTVANVPRLKLLFTQQVNAQVYAQPLYMHGVPIPGQGTHNVVFVATEADTVYAFDADANHPALWQRTLTPAGEMPLSVSDISECGNIAPVIGITSTPVIDAATATMYVVAKTKRVQGAQTTYHYYLYALDITTGKDRPGSPREIQAAVTVAGQSVPFVPRWQLNRPALLLQKGIVYIAFGSHCDSHAMQYHGWVLAYEAATLKQVAVFNATPDGGQAGIWQGGMGLAADASGAIYLATGNGTFTADKPGGKDFGNAVIKLGADLKVLDFFTPANQATLDASDIDFGSGGVVVLPDQAASSTSHAHLAVTCGKDGRVFLLNRDKLGEYNGPQGPDRVVQTLELQPGATPQSQPGIWGGPAYYQGQQGQFVYYCGRLGHLKAFKLQDGLLSLGTVEGGQPNQSTENFPGSGGSTPTVSSNQQVAGTAIVWALVRTNPLRLRAYDATNLTVKLFEGEAGPWTNAGGGAFIEPTVIQGKVYVGSDHQLNVFGL